MDKLIGRDDEIAKLDRFCRLNETKVAVIYGRRGIGKTSLVRAFLQQRQGMYFEAYQTTGMMELALMEHALFGGSGAYDASFFPDEEEPSAKLLALLGTLRTEAERRAPEDPLILAIDHYPDFAGADDSLAETLFRFVTELPEELPFRLILIGDSYIRMQKCIGGKKAPWKDLQLLRMEVKPLSFRDSTAFFPEESAEGQVFFYGITGGVPERLKSCSGKTAEEAFFDAVMQQKAPWQPENLMLLELRELSYYNRILTALAAGLTRVNEISAHVAKPKDVVVPYLNTLMSIGLVTKENPVTEPGNRRKTRYYIVNPGDVFHYRYAPACRVALPAAEEERHEVFRTQIRPALGNWMRQVFREICRQYLLLADARDELPLKLGRLGNWWENDDENHTTEGFDLVGLGTCPTGEAALFAVCDFRPEQVDIRELKDLIGLTKKAGQKETTFYCIFSRSGFTENAKTVAAAIRNILFYSLEDILAELKRQ